MKNLSLEIDFQDFLSNELATKIDEISTKALLNIKEKIKDA